MTVEERLNVLEREMAELKAARGHEGKNWIAKISGSFKGDPEFGEILRLGREIRQADKPEDGDGGV